MRFGAGSSLERAPARVAAKTTMMTKPKRTARMNNSRHRQERSRWSILTTTLAMLCVLVVSFAAPSRSFSSNDQLTTEDKKLLAAGELVMKHKNEQRGAYKLIGGQSWQIIDVPVDVAWEALANLTGLQEFHPARDRERHQASSRRGSRLGDSPGVGPHRRSIRAADDARGRPSVDGLSSRPFAGARHPGRLGLHASSSLQGQPDADFLRRARRHRRWCLRIDHSPGSSEGPASDSVLLQTARRGAKSPRFAPTAFRTAS